MTDEHLRTFLLDDPEIGAGERRAIEDHVKACAACRASLESFRRARRLLAPAKSVGEDRGFLDGVMTRLDPGAPPRTSQGMRSLPAALGAAVLLVFAAVASLMFATGGPEATTADLLSAADEGGFYSWATAEGEDSEDAALAFVMEDF